MMHHIMRLFVLIVAVFAIDTGAIAAGKGVTEPAAQLGLVPLPVSVERGDGVFALNSQTRLYAAAGAEAVAKQIAAEVKHYAGVGMRHSRTWRGKNILRLELTKAAANPSDEAYELTIDRRKITIRAATPEGIYRGAQTLFQLTDSDFFDSAVHRDSWNFHAATIADAPRFSWRGLMLDVSRHFFDKQVVMRLIDKMAQHKLNILHLHLTDDPGWRIEVKKYPKLAEIGGRGDRSNPEGQTPHYFTQADLSEIVAYAKVRHIEVIPEIDMPGHSAAAARAYPEFFDGNKTINPGRAETYDFVKDIFAEVKQVFPSSYVHFGADEVRDIKWHLFPEIAKFMQEKNLPDHHALEGYFDRFEADHLLSTGRTPVAWDEAAAHDVDPRTVIIWWRGRQPESRDHAIGRGHKVVISPADHLYFDYPQALGEPGAPWEGNDNGPNSLDLIYKWDPVPEAYTAEQSAKIIGVQAAIWTEFIASEKYMEFMTFPRLSALAELGWTPQEQRDLHDFKLRLEHQLKRYDAMGLNYRIPGEWESPNADQYIRN